MQRLAYLRTPEEIKVAMVFLFTMPGVPFVYYGDEIGMDYIPGLPSKEGGYIRTGSRTPMQWNHEKNCGFSVSDTPYLPVDCREGSPTVSTQEHDENSLLLFMKKLIALHKTNTAFYAEADFHVLFSGYPFVYERIDGCSRFFIALNPSQYCCYYTVPQLGEIVLRQNIELQGKNLVMNGISFLIAKID